MDAAVAAPSSLAAGLPVDFFVVFLLVVTSQIAYG
jgi:hypothetical protein